MAEVPNSYFVVQNRIPKIMEAIRTAGIPTKFTSSFLESLGFKSTNDRPIIAILKSMGFLDQNGIPTQIYRSYKDSAQSKKILALGIKEAYEGIFSVHEKANTLSIQELKGKFASVTGKSDSVVEKMAQTFKAFCNLADFSGTEDIKVRDEEVKQAIEANVSTEEDIDINSASTNTPPKAQFHYNIQIHLPVTRDISVYNAIFKSLKDHLF